MQKIEDLIVTWDMVMKGFEGGTASVKRRVGGRKGNLDILFLFSKAQKKKNHQFLTAPGKMR